MSFHWDELQKTFCVERGVDFVASRSDLKVGYSTRTEGRLPINGLRHVPTATTTGWYIWFGEDFSSDEDFFEPLHVIHLKDRCPEALTFLGLPPGYRFLKAGDYVDVWFDASLIES